MNQAKKSRKPETRQGTIRIIAGKHRGRKLPVLDAVGLRPTTDRVKETLFNWLMAHIHGSRCLDCFAGSGGLGFEALSRGAEQVTLIEMNKAAAKQLQQNLNALNSSNAEIHQGDCLQFLAQPPARCYDIVFIDPPFRQGLLREVCQRLQQGWLAEQALLYIEMEAEGDTDCIPTGWQLLKEKIAGQVAYRLYQAE